ncbi:MAG TPA: hypothetical protein DF613_00475 [Lachnospiraceae bacterium]|nr:hypothetical protein [Lachnospiraceae bacterium]
MKYDKMDKKGGAFVRRILFTDVDGRRRGGRRRPGAAAITAEYEGFILTYAVEVSYKDAVSALRYCFKHYGSTYSQKNRMEEGSYDCSSFVWRAYRSVKRKLGGDKDWAPTAADLAKWCVKNKYMIYAGTVSTDKLLPGDLIFECDPSEANGRYKGIYHVDMYQGNGVLITVERQKANREELRDVMIARPCLDKTSGLSAAAKLSAPKAEVKKNSGGTVKLSWGRVKEADGYVVARSTEKNGTYVKVKTIRKGAATGFTQKGLKKGSTCYYRVKAYKKVKGKIQYGRESAAVKVKVK